MSVPSSPSLFGKSRGYAGFIGDGNAHDKRAAAVLRIVPAQDFAAVGANDAVANTQAESSAFTSLLGGVKGVENPLGIGDSGSVLGNGHFNRIAAQPRAYGNAPTVPGLLHR